MRFMYLGTAAAEGWPAVFCNCPSCREAMRLGGRNIRTRSQSLINEDFLIDLPPDTYLHKLRFGLDLSKVRYLFITHMHMDHFYPQELSVRGGGYSHDMVSEDLDIYCARETEDFFNRTSAWETEKDSLAHMHFHTLKAFEPVQAGGYRVVPLRASHMQDGNEPFIYHITDEDGKQVLYLHDSGFYRDDVWDYFKSICQDKKAVDMVSFDGTLGDAESSHGHHMGIYEVFRTKQHMMELGVIDAHTHCVMNHFSHNGHLLYDQLVQASSVHGIDVAFDGYTFTI